MQVLLTAGLPGPNLFSMLGSEFSRKLPESVMEVWSLETLMGAVAYGPDHCDDDCPQPAFPFQVLTWGRWGA